MSDIRFNQWLHNSGTGGVSQVDGGHVGIGTTNPLIPVGAGNTSILNVGVVTANSYYGSGANLTSLPAQVTITGNADNRVITGGSGTNLNGEANLTFDGSSLGVKRSGGGDVAVNIECGNTISQSRILFRDSSDIDGIITYDHNDRKLFLGAGTNNATDGDIAIDSAGRVLIGGYDSSIEPDGYASSLQVHGTATDAGISILRYSNNSGSPTLLFGKSRGASIGSFSTVQNNDSLGKIEFYGTDTDWESSASIRASADGEWYTSSDATDAPGRLEFHTTPNGSDQLVERLRITSEGYLFVRDNGVTQTNTTLSYQSEGAFLTHYTARTTAGGDRYRRMFDIASVGANPHGSSIRFLTSPDDTNPAVTVERVRIDHNGRVGINKTQPQTMLSIKAERSATPRFGIDGHYSDSSYTQCTWDDSSGLYTLLGVNHKLDANGNDATAISSLHSASILLDGRSGNIRFNIKPNSGGATTEVMRIRDNGCVNIGNSLASSAAGRLMVVEERGGNQTNDCNAYFETNANDWNIKTYYNSAGTHYHIMFLEQGTNRGMITGSDGSNVTYSGGSDYRWKENIVEMTGTEGIDICKKLKPSKYNWIENREETGQINTVDGFIAHEVVEAGVLGAVTGEKDAVNEDGSIKGQMLDYGQMTPVLAAAIKGLITKVETLEQDNIALRVRVTNLEGN
nr:endo-N-actetylneuraminidase [uncultured Mediterranean phage uvMED]